MSTESKPRRNSSDLGLFFGIVIGALAGVPTTFFLFKKTRSHPVYPSHEQLVLQQLQKPLTRGVMTSPSIKPKMRDGAVLLRQDVTNKNLVLCYIPSVTSKSEKPSQYAKGIRGGFLLENAVSHDPACPFCPGNESKTPPSILEEKDDSGLWNLRVIPNKYPYLCEIGDIEAGAYGSVHLQMDAKGCHFSFTCSLFTNQVITKL